MYNQKLINSFLSILIVICFSLTVAVAQETGNEKYRVKIKIDKDGEVTEIDEVFEDLDDAKLQQLLSEHNIDAKINGNNASKRECWKRRSDCCEKGNKFQRLEGFNNANNKFRMKINSENETEIEQFIAEVEALAQSRGLDVEIDNKMNQYPGKMRMQKFFMDRDNAFNWSDAKANQFKMRTESKPVIGINIKNNENGVEVISLMDGFGAQKAGMLAGDIITNVEGFTVNTIEDLLNVLKEKQEGERVSISYLRNGNRMSTKVTLQTLEARAPMNFFENRMYDENCCTKEEREKCCPDNKRMENLGRKLEQRFRNYDWDRIEDSFENFEGDLKDLGNKIEREIEIIVDNFEGDADTNVEIIIEDEPNTKSYDSNTNNYDYFSPMEEQIDAGLIDNISPNADLQRMNSSDLQNFEVYPNPGNGNFNIKFNTPFVADIAILVYNLNGKIVYDAELSKFSGNFFGNIDIQDQPRGTYILEVIRKGKKLNKQLILQ